MLFFSFTNGEKEAVRWGEVEYQRLNQLRIERWVV